MYVVIFQVENKPEHKADYLAVAAQIREELVKIDGFLSVERFVSLANPDKLLSLSFWRDEAAIKAWRDQEAHRAAQAQGRETFFQEYRISVAEVIRDYTLHDTAGRPV